MKYTVGITVSAEYTTPMLEYHVNTGKVAGKAVGGSTGLRW